MTVKRLSFSEFSAAFTGWLRANRQTPDALDADDAAEVAQMLDTPAPWEVTSHG